MSSRALPRWAYPFAIRAARMLGERAAGDRIATTTIPWKSEPEKIFDRVHRSAGQVRPEEGMGRLSAPDEGSPPGRPAGKGGNRRSGTRPELAEEQRPEGRLAEETAVPEAPGLENPRDFSDQVERATIERATKDVTRVTGEKPPESFWRAFGMGRGQPGHGDHFFNVVNALTTLPRTKAALDWRFNKAYGAVLGAKRTAAELVHDYHRGLESWQGKPLSLMNKVFSAMEVLSRQGREVPLDGRSIIVENDQNHTALSKKGDVIRLTKPEEIRMFTDYRKTMDQVWRDFIAESARQFGWEGEPTTAAIYKAVEEASGSEKKRLERIARTLAAIEYQRRASYVPFMRSGEYYIRIKPTSPSEEWDGQGKPPTVMFKMMDPFTAAERAMGGIREGTPQLVRKALDDLRKDFPEDAYEIEHGYLFRDTDAVKDLDVPAIDKLLMIASNDVRGILRDRLERSGVDPDRARQTARNDYDKMVDAVLDQIYEQRVAGFRRPRMGIPGYDADFVRSTGRYFSWLSNYIAAMRHRADLDAGEQLMATHPDPRSRAYWRDFQRRHDDWDQLNTPLAVMRQAAFYWLLGANAATTAKIMLHGPMRGVPILGTGMGAQGRARAAADFLAATKDIAKSLRVGKSGIEVDPMAGAKDAAERAMISDAEAKGILHPATKEELEAARYRGERVLTDNGRFFNRVLDIWGSNVSAADRMIRGAMLLSGYRLAKRVGMDAINRVWDKDLNWRNAPKKTPEAFGQFLVDHTVGVWGDVNRMPLMRSHLGGLVGQFRTYELGYISNVHQMMTRMGPEGKVTAALMLGGLGMMGGAVALPFAEDAEEAAELVWKTITGIEPDLKVALKDAMNAMVPGSGEMVVHGPAREVTGIDWSGLGFGEILTESMGALNTIGAAVSTFGGAPYRAYERYQTGQEPLAVVRELLPNAVKNLIGSLYPETALASAATGTRVLAERQLSDADRLKMAFGFNPEIRAEKYEKITEIGRLRDSYKAAISKAENRVANLIARGENPGEAYREAGKIILDGQKAGVFTPHEAQEFRNILRAKLRNRLHPEIPSRMQQRVSVSHQNP